MAQTDIQLLLLDIDGTIAGQSNTIREPVLKAIQAAQAKGVQVGIATGRMYQSALRFYEAVGSVLPLAAYQGAWIQDPRTGTVHHHLPVSCAIAGQLLDHFEEPPLRDALSVHFYINDQLYVRELTPETRLYAERSQITPVVVGDLRTVFPQQPTKILALSKDTEMIGTLLGGLQQRYTPAELYLTSSVASFFEATHPTANKGTAAAFIAEKLLGLSAEQVMTVGDNFNDVEMLQYAGIGVAMGDAPEAVKACADWVAPSVEADGVVAAIEEFIL